MAAKGEAEHQSDARKRVAEFKAAADIASAEANRKAHVQVNMQAQAEAESDRDLHMKRNAYDREVNRTRAEADAATAIAQAQQQQVVTKETTQQKVEEAAILIEVTKREVERQKQELDGNSQAELLAQRNQAEGIKVLAEAEADVLRQKAEAFKQYGEAAIVQSIVERMPEIAEAVAAPLAQTEKMVFVSQDGSSASRLTNDVVSMVGSIPTAVEGLTGINLRKAVSSGGRKAGH